MIQRGQGKKNCEWGCQFVHLDPQEKISWRLPAPFLPLDPALQRDEDRCCGSQVLSALIQAVSLPHLLAALLCGFPHLVTILLVNTSSYDNGMQSGLALSHHTPDSPNTTREGTQAAGCCRHRGHVLIQHSLTRHVTPLDESGGRESCTVGGTRIRERRPTD